MDEGTLIWTMVFGAFGLGYFSYGKKQKRFIPFVSGVLLMVFPMFVTDTLWTVLIGLALMVLPFVVRY